jgi:hypothetical protein
VSTVTLAGPMSKRQTQLPLASSGAADGLLRALSHFIGKGTSLKNLRLWSVVASPSCLSMSLVKVSNLKPLPKAASRSNTGTPSARD